MKKNIPNIKIKQQFHSIEILGITFCEGLTQKKWNKKLKKKKKIEKGYTNNKKSH